MRAGHRAVLLWVSALTLPSHAVAFGKGVGDHGAPAAKVIYTSSDFARYAPNTAYDLLVHVPGFTIRLPDQQRGLGEASENVLINDERIANKSGGAIDELQKIAAANVERIEIVDAAALGIAGLSGQVANVVLRRQRKPAGQFEWNPAVPAYFGKAYLFRGAMSYSGQTGSLEYSISAKDETDYAAYGGPIIIYDRFGVITETRRERYDAETDNLTLQTKFGIHSKGGSTANFALSYSPYWAPAHFRDQRTSIDAERSSRTTDQQQEGWYYDVNGDYEFPFIRGHLKVVGVRHFEHNPVITTQILRFESPATAAEGTRFSRDSGIGETIFRAEYAWQSGANEWQVTSERAFNSLDQKGDLRELDASGNFRAVPFPEGSGKVTEVRYEIGATLSRPLTRQLNLQMTAGAEVSRLDRVDDGFGPRKFVRPKGSVDFAWRPSRAWDLSLKLRRRVGQISFYDFLAQPILAEDRQNEGNPDLVPPQSWELEAEVGHDLRQWGTTRVRGYAHAITDIIDVIPLPGHGEGIGNLPHATKLGVESTSTLQFDVLGWTGAKLDAQLGYEWTRVTDPLTKIRRPISGTRDKWIVLELRDDLPRTNLAWGATAKYNHYTNNYFLSEIFRTSDGPWSIGAYLEHKDVLGMKFRAEIQNIVSARHRLKRSVYVDWRDTTSVSFVQRNNELIGPIFSFRVQGSF